MNFKEIHHARCLIEENDKVLFTLNNINYWKFWWKFLLPWWKIEKWETPKDAVIRELFEETALRVNIIWSLWIDSRYLPDKALFLVWHYFVWKVDDILALENKEEDKHSLVRELPISILPWNLLEASIINRYLYNYK